MLRQDAPLIYKLFVYAKRWIKQTLWYSSYANVIL